MTRFLAALFVVGATVAPASAQIYSWRDASGALVVSDRPREGDAASAAATYMVPGTAAVKTTRAVGLSSKAAAFDDVIEMHATAQGVEPDLVRAVIQVESAFNPAAVSAKGAMGLMQLMPATARELGVDNPFQPEENIRGGVAYLRQLLDRYDRNVELALAAYNAGPGSVAKYGGAVPPYRETQAYVRKVTDVTGPVAPAPPAHTIYKWIEARPDGRVVVRYGNKPPAGVSATPVGGR